MTPPVHNRYRCRSRASPDVVTSEWNRTARGARRVKYMMLIAGSEEAWSHMTPDEEAALMQRIGGWWGDHSAAGRIIEGHQLEPVATATTVRRDGGGEATVTDGPFMEGKE